MEHLPLPRDVAAPGPSHVPYVCREDYDGGPFLTYPIRQGKAHVLVAVEELRHRYDPSLILLPVVELEDLIQTWLFFGLLREVLGDSCKSSQFVQMTTATESPRIVNTSGLLPEIKAWVTDVQQSSCTKFEKQAQYDHIAECLQLTATVLHAVQHELQPKFNRTIRMSIASVAQLLGNATNVAYNITDLIRENKCPETWRLFYDDPEVSLQLRRNGFCPSEIKRIRGIFGHTQTYHLLSWMDRSEPIERHDDCTDRDCRASHNNLERYATKHTSDTCRCTNYVVNVLDVFSVLARGSLPILRISLGATVDDVKVAVLAASPNIKYVALSHVWSDGLGNPNSNSLPKCQLRRLHVLMSRLVATPGGKECGQNLYIWIDTLCCPVRPPVAKKLALSKMKTPYTDASHVFVLDATLERLENLGLHPTETLLRIFTTRWMRRLWTLQEGALARNLWFQFKDKAVDLRQLEVEVTQVYFNDLGRKGLVADIMPIHRGLRNYFQERASFDKLPLTSVNDAMAFRSVSVAVDEPLLIAGLLKLDVVHVLDGPNSSRMQRLYSLIPSIPRNILFHRGSKLHQPGFRWAPSSFLTSKDTGDASMDTADGLRHIGILTPQGLRVQLAAFPIMLRRVSQSLPKNPWGLFDSERMDSVYGRYEDGSWFYFSRKYEKLSTSSEKSSEPTLWQLLQQNTGSHAVLLESPFHFNGLSEARQGLLVRRASNDHSASEVISEMMVNIKIIRGEMAALHQAAYQASRVLLADELTAEFNSLAIDAEADQKVNPSFRILIDSLSRTLQCMADNIDDPRVLSVIQSIFPDPNRRLFKDLTANLYLGSYAELGEMLPSDTEWCVD
ncbi:MAG: hypothetical protein Q9181_007091 [Wetmoreana brouardii]